MMSYRYDRQKRTRHRWYVVLALGFILVLFTPVFSWLFILVEAPLVRSWENKQEFFDGSENFIESLYGSNRILAKNKELEQEIKRLEVDNLRTSYLSHELEKIYQTGEKDNSFSTARILSQGTLGSSDTMIVNQGLNNGIAIGDTVFTFEHILLGFVSEVYNTTSQITLYSHTQQSIDGVLFPHDVNLIAHGYGKGSFIIETPREIEVEQGDIFYSLQQPGNIIGIVRDVTFDARDPFKKVYISYPLNVSEIQTVNIKKQTPNSIIE